MLSFLVHLNPDCKLVHLMSGSEQTYNVVVQLTVVANALCLLQHAFSSVPCHRKCSFGLEAAVNGSHLALCMHMFTRTCCTGMAIESKLNLTGTLSQLQCNQ